MSAVRYFLIGASISTVVATCSALLFWAKFADGHSQQLANIDDDADGFYDESIVNPAMYRSDSKSFQLSVNPSDRKGRGGAAYEMRKEGVLVWASKLPFTLLDVVVTNSGESVGCSYSHGLEGFQSDGAGGDFRVVILGPDGNPRLNESTNREPSSFLHELPNPKSVGHFVDEAHDKVFFRIADPEVNRQSESWWVYKLSTGGSVGRVNLRERMKETEHLRTLLDARVVKGTPLILCHWWRFQYPDPSGHRNLIVGGRFALVDEQGTPVWELELPSDFVIKDDEGAQDRLISYVQRHGAFLKTSEPASFDLYFASDSQRVTFSVAEDSGAWAVHEVARQPLVITDILKPRSIAENIPLTPLRSLEQIRLETTQADSPIRQVTAFTFDQKGRIGFIRQSESNVDDFVLVDSAGELICEIALNNDLEEDSRISSCTWISGDRFLVTCAAHGIEKNARAWWIDVAEQKLSPVAEFKSPPIEQLLKFSDGGFVALATTRYKHTMVDGLYGFDAMGRNVWAVDTEGSNGPSDLFSPQDITVTAGDQVAVLDNIQNAIQIFTREGKLVRSLDLEQTWGREPNYLSAISAIRDGFVIHDFDGSPPYVVTGLDGRVASGFTPKLDTGRVLNASKIAIAPDGTMWTTDGDAIFRLKADGVVDRVLGLPPETNQLANIACSAVDRLGQMYFVESRNARVHVFDSAGRSRGVCIPDPADFARELFDTSVSVNDSGELSLCVDGMLGAGNFVQFSPSGKCIRSVKLSMNTGCWVAQPGTDKTLVLPYDKAVFLDSNRVAVQEISRRPDGNWLTRPKRVSFAQDGSFALLDSKTVSIYKADGTPERCITLPALVGRFPRIAYNRNRLVVSGDGFVIFYDPTGALLQASKLELVDKYVQPHIIASGKELLIVPSQAPNLYRFEMP